MGVIEVKGVRIGEGMPKTVVSLMGGTAGELCGQARRAQQAGADCLEWRADFYADIHDALAVARDARTLAAELPDTPLIFTFRSAAQGGKRDLDLDEYVALNQAVIETGAIDFCDIELSAGDDTVRALTAFAHGHGVRAIVSHHDFAETPPAGLMAEIMGRELSLGADIPKVAVMAHDEDDAVELACAAQLAAQQHPGVPLLALAMGEAGTITRLAGELFGSALTFCALDAASAPGQVDLATAQQVMTEIHNTPRDTSGGACSCPTFL